MNVEEIKQKFRNVFGEQILFNKDFGKYVLGMKNLDDNLLDWCIKVRDDEITPKFTKRLDEGMVFIKKIGSSNRCIIIKIKNGEFKEVHLGDHDYYMISGKSWV